MKTLILIATKKELGLIGKIPNLTEDFDIKITGVGAYSVFKTLTGINFSRYDEVINIGYAGGEKIGEVLEVGQIINRGHIDNPDVKQEKLTINKKAITLCQTGDYFHTDKIEENSVYDMELWYIAKAYNTNNKLRAYKVVSDNGSMEEYEQNS